MTTEMTDATTHHPTDATAPASHWTGASDDGFWLAAAREIAPALAERAELHDREGSFVADNFELLRDRGFLSMAVPRDLGGGGATHAETCATLAEFARACPSTALTFSMHSHLIAAQVWRHLRGLPAPALSRVADDQLLLISTGASDWLGSSGTATKVEGGFRVSARKMPASGAPAGDVLVTSVRWDDASEGPQVVHLSIPFAADGVSIVETWDTMGMRGTGSHTVVIDDVFVPDGAVALTRPAGVWHPVWSTVLGAAVPLIMSCYVGLAEEAADRTLELVGSRRARPETAPLVGQMLNRLTTARDTVSAMLDASSDLRFDNTLQHAAGSLTRKTVAAQACIDTVCLALEVGGGMAYSRSSRIERMFRDVHGALYHPLPAAQQQRFTGRLALGLDPLDGL